MVIQLDEKNTAEHHILLSKLLKQLCISAPYAKIKLSKNELARGKKANDLRKIHREAGLSDIFKVDDSCKLVLLDWKVNENIINLGDNIKIEKGHFPGMVVQCFSEGKQNIIHTIQYMNSIGQRL